MVDFGKGGVYQLNQAGDLWYLQQEGTTLWGTGASPSEALDDLKAREERFAAFQEESGYRPIDLEHSQARVSRWARQSWPFFRPLLIFSLCCIPLAYAINAGIQGGAISLRKAITEELGGDLWQQIDGIVLRMGDEKYDLTDEQRQRIATALKRISERYGKALQTVQSSDKPASQ